MTPTSWPMAMEPMEEDPHLLGGRSRPRVSPGSSAPVRLPNPKIANVFVESVGAHLQGELDGGHVAGFLERLVDGNHAHVLALIVVNNAAAGQRDLAALAVDHVVGVGDVWSSAAE